MSVGARTLTLVAEQSNNANVARGAEDGGWQQTKCSDQAGEGAVLTRHLDIGLRDNLILRSVKRNQM